MNQRYSVYNHVDFHTSNPLKIVLMLYDGAIQFLKQAVSCTESGDVKNKNIYTGNARDIIMELNNALNVDQGGEIATHLRSLYFYMIRRLMSAGWSNDVQGFQEVISLLSNLREAWQEISLQKERLDMQAPPRAAGIRA